MATKQRNIRKRRALDEQEAASDDEQQLVSVKDTKIIQKSRQRKTGIEATALAVVDKAPRLEDIAAGAAGGPDVLEAAFKKENRRAVAEEDPHMKKYIEEQLAKRLGREHDQDAAQPSGAGGQPGNDVALGESVRARQVDTELAPTWVTGILEVPLSLEHKLKNIEETEAAKQRMLARSGAGVAALLDDNDEDEGSAQQQALRRGMYPVHFGRQREGESERIQASMAKKQRMREVQREKKLKKKQEFQGW